MLSKHVEMAVRRILVTIVSISMAFSMMPAPVLAEESNQTLADEEEGLAQQEPSTQSGEQASDKKDVREQGSSDNSDPASDPSANLAPTSDPASDPGADPDPSTDPDDPDPSTDPDDPDPNTNPDEDDPTSENVLSAEETAPDDAISPAQDDSSLSAQATFSGIWGDCRYSITDDGVLTVYPGAGNPVTNNQSPWKDFSSRITSVRFVEEDGNKVTVTGGASYLFENLSKVTSMDLSGFDTSEVTGMECMFKGCTSLTTLDLKDWDTSKVCYMSHMFSGCEQLGALDLSSWNTGCVVSMSSMFYDCKALNTVGDLSGWDTSKVTSASSMFENCNVLNSVGNLSEWKTSALKYADSMFANCWALTSLDVSGWNTSSLERTNNMFYACLLIPELDVSGWDTTNVTKMGSMFNRCSSMASVGDLSEWNTPKVTDMSSMFRECSALSEVDVSNFTVSQVEWISSMFNGCSSLTSVGDLSGWELSSKVTNTSYMFAGCSRLSELDVSGFDMSQVANMSQMFSGCSSLATLNGVSDWNTPSVKNMSGVFWGCSSLTSLDLSQWSTSQVTDMGSLFRDCSSLASVSVSEWDTPQVTSTRYAFYGCNALRSLDLTGWDTTNVTDGDMMFEGCKSLDVFKVGNKFAFKSNYMTPRSSDGYNWWSNAEHKWFYIESFPQKRSCVADTYTALCEPGYERDITDAELIYLNSYPYDGKEHKQEPKVTYQSYLDLRNGIDCDVTYLRDGKVTNDFKSAGKITVRITGKNNFTGTITSDYEIWKGGQPMEAWAVARKAPAASLKSRDVAVEAPIHVAHAVSAGKPLEYRKKGGDSRLNVDVATGRVTVRKGTPAGTYKVTIRAIAHGGANYADGSRTVDCQVQVVAGKLDQDFQVSAADVTRTASSLAGADYLTRPFSAALAAGNVTYKWASGTPKGTYYAKVWATAAGDAGYKQCTRTVTVEQGTCFSFHLLSWWMERKTRPLFHVFRSTLAECDV